MPESGSISPVKIIVDFWTVWRYPHTLLETGIGEGILCNQSI